MKLSPSIEALDYKTNSPCHPLGNVLRTINGEQYGDSAITWR